MAVLGLDPQGLPYSNGLAQQVSPSLLRCYRTLTRQTALRDSHSRARARAQAQAQAQYDARVQQQQQQFQNQQRVQLQSQAQQQQLIQAILIAQETGQATHQYREALAAQAQQAITVNSRLQAQGQLVLQAQAERALFATQLQQQQQRQQYQQQLYPYREQQTQIPAYTEDRSVLAAQVQANLQAQTNRNRASLNEADIRARFGNATNNVANAYVNPKTSSQPVFENVHSPFGDAMWKSHAPQSRQAQSAYETQTRSTPTSSSRFSTSQGDSISTFLARRRATDESSRSSESEATLISIDTAIVSRADTAQMSPNPSISEKEHEKVTAQAVLGNGRPGPLLPTSRVWTTPAQSTNKAGDSPTPRSASHPGGNARTIFPLRQPTGPPGEAKELGEKNFQSR